MKQLGAADTVDEMTSPPAAVELYWLPLGAGGHSVRLNGRVFEAIVALLERRDRRDLYHAALIVRLPEGRFVIEQGPAWSGVRADRGVVVEGPVGMRALGRFKLFRYEIRCWPDGVIPDADEAVDSPKCLNTDPAVARRLLELARDIPAGVWGRDEFRTGEMWNSNSVVAWLIARSGLDVAAVRFPDRGRAPGWSAGVEVARREPASTSASLARAHVPVG